MTHITKVPAPDKCSGDDNVSGERDLLLAALRVASSRARLVANELDAIGTSLSHRATTCAAALVWLQDEGLLSWLPCLKPETQR